MRRTIALVAAAAVVGVTLAACSRGGDRAADSAAGETGAAARGDTGRAAGAGDGTISVMMRNAAGRELGTLTVADSGMGIQINGHLTGLPVGAHGIHIHMVGRCEPPFESAGDHWNPANKKHGMQNPEGPLMGDLPNITVDADGAAIVIHASGDDFRTDPSGNSGARIACGVVTGS